MISLLKVGAASAFFIGICSAAQSQNIMRGIWYGAMRCGNHVRELQIVMRGSGIDSSSPGFLIMTPTWTEPLDTHFRVGQLSASTIDGRTIVSVVDAKTGDLQNGTRFVGNFKDSRGWDFFGHAENIPGCTDFYMKMSLDAEDIAILEKAQDDIPRYVGLLAVKLNKPLDAGWRSLIRQREDRAREASRGSAKRSDQILLGIAAAVIISSIASSGGSDSESGSTVNRSNGWSIERRKSGESPAEALRPLE